jgi:PPM family protein phosphatase
MEPPPPTHTRLKWSGRTDRGKVRPNNEDAFLGVQFDAREIHHLGQVGEGSVRQSDFAFAVSDGMGGAMAGEHASRIAMEKITKLLPATFGQAAAGLNADFPGLVGELFDEIHRALTHLGNSYEECSGMETTLSLCWFTPGRMFFGHVGDSRIYHLAAGVPTLVQLSHDDTHVGWLRRNGKISEREARNHPRRNVLQKALGAGNQFVEPQVGAIPCEAGDTFLLCTDGLVESLYDHDLAALLRSPEMHAPGASVARRLVDEAVSRHGRDNTTAVVIELV